MYYIVYKTVGMGYHINFRDIKGFNGTIPFVI